MPFLLHKSADIFEKLIWQEELGKLYWLTRLFSESRDHCQSFSFLDLVQGTQPECLSWQDISNMVNENRGNNFSTTNLVAPQ